MRHARDWMPITALAVAALAMPGFAFADFVCPECDGDSRVVLGVSHVVELVLSTILQRGVALLVLGATAIVSLPWLVAGTAVVAFSVARRLGS